LSSLRKANSNQSRSKISEKFSLVPRPKILTTRPTNMRFSMSLTPLTTIPRLQEEEEVTKKRTKGKLMDKVREFSANNND